MAAYRVVSTDTRLWLRGLVESRGVRNTARQLDIADATVMRALAELKLQASMVELLDARRRQAREAA